MAIHTTEKKIVLFDTDEFYQITLDLVLYNMGLDPAQKVGKKADVKKAIVDIEAKKLRPDVVIVDTYMGINNDDGKKIADKIREISPETKIVGYSIMETNEWADFEIIKSLRNPEKSMVRVLEEALDAKFNASDVDDPEYMSAGV